MKWIIASVIVLIATPPFFLTAHMWAKWRAKKVREEREDGPQGSP